jgi:uncharacterized protein
MEYAQTDRNTVRRLPIRGHYDQATVHAILDAGYLCHVAFTVDDQPFVIPTIYGRRGESIYLHGSPASRMLKNLAQGIKASLSVTHVDGLVLARSAFHHSLNYRSVVVFGRATRVEGAEKEQGLLTISEQVLKGRWQEVRKPNAKELNATLVLRLNMESASAKNRTGPPKDEADDYALPVWAGTVPIHTRFSRPQPDAKLPCGMELPGSVRSLVAD